MFRYRLHSPDGDDLGEATYAQMIHPDEEIIAGANQRFRHLTRTRTFARQVAVRLPTRSLVRLERAPFREFGAYSVPKPSGMILREFPLSSILSRFVAARSLR
jgi:hypothetical protein